MLGELKTTEAARPAGIERRLVLSLLTYWRGLIGEADFPSFADLDPAAIPDMWPHCFVLDVTEYPEDPIVRVAQPSIMDDAGSVIGKHISALPRATLLGQAVSFTDEALRKCVPVSRGGDFVRQDGARVLYRSILLPMSDDGVTICGLFGAANSRTVMEP
jgi:hypothetical protein